MQKNRYININDIIDKEIFRMIINTNNSYLLSEIIENKNIGSYIDKNIIINCLRRYDVFKILLEKFPEKFSNLKNIILECSDKYVYHDKNNNYLEVLKFAKNLEVIKDDIFKKSFIKKEIECRNINIVKWIFETTDIEIDKEYLFFAIQKKFSIQERETGIFEFLFNNYYDINDKLIEELLLYASKFNVIEIIKILYNDGICDDVIIQSMYYIYNYHNRTRNSILKPNDLKWLLGTKYKKFLFLLEHSNVKILITNKNPIIFEEFEKNIELISIYIYLYIHL